VPQRSKKVKDLPSFITVHITDLNPETQEELNQSSKQVQRELPLGVKIQTCQITLAPKLMITLLYSCHEDQNYSSKNKNNIHSKRLQYSHLINVYESTKCLQTLHFQSTFPRQCSRIEIDISGRYIHPHTPASTRRATEFTWFN
jgi:hypothetical protein